MCAQKKSEPLFYCNVCFAVTRTHFIASYILRASKCETIQPATRANECERDGEAKRGEEKIRCAKYERKMCCKIYFNVY